MDNQALANLNDIMMPEPISWWPMAIGWDVVALLILAGITLMVSYGGRYYYHQLPKQQALKLLKQYQLNYQHHQDSVLYSASINALLKRVALAYFGRTKVAGLYDQAWLEFLNQTANNINVNNVGNLLLVLPYVKSADNIDLQPLFTFAHAWIKQRGQRCSP